MDFLPDASIRQWIAFGIQEIIIIFAIGLYVESFVFEKQIGTHIKLFFTTQNGFVLKSTAQIKAWSINPFTLTCDGQQLQGEAIAHPVAPITYYCLDQTLSPGKWHVAGIRSENQGFDLMFDEPTTVSYTKSKWIYMLDIYIVMFLLIILTTINAAFSQYL